MNNFVQMSYRQLNKLQLRSVLSLGASYTLLLFHGDMFNEKLQVHLTSSGKSAELLTSEQLRLKSFSLRVR
jgi:hypothetical protein